VVPAGWDGRNPVDIRVDAPGERYAAVLEQLLRSREFDAVLAIHTPSALASSTDVARAIVRVAAAHGGNLLASFVGTESAAPARRILLDAGLPGFDAPADAARAFRLMVSHRLAREALLETPPSVPEEFAPDPEAVRRVIGQALEDGRDWLRVNETMAVLSAYGLPVADVHTASTPEEAAAVADCARPRGTLPVFTPRG